MFFYDDLKCCREYLSHTGESFKQVLGRQRPDSRCLLEKIQILRNAGASLADARPLFIPVTFDTTATSDTIDTTVTNYITVLHQNVHYLMKMRLYP
jgi:hypothetical protein